MIEGINSYNFQIQNVQNKKPSVCNECKQNVTTNPIDSYTMSGLESLGIYNMTLIKDKDNFNHKPAELIIPTGTLMKDINGDKVCDPYGKLEYIVQNDGKYETRYYPDEEKPEFVSNVEIRNLYDGKLLKEQHCTNNSDWTSVTEYSQEQPNISYHTRYSEGKVRCIEKNEKMPDGSTKNFSKSFYNTTPELSIDLNDKNYKNSISVDLDSQNMVKSIWVNRTTGNIEHHKDITLNKGAIIGISETKDTVIPNFMERDVLNDNDVIPTDKFNKEKIEAMAKNNPKDIYSFYGNGQLKEINDKNIKVEFHEDGSQIIKEYISDKITKTTSYYEDGRISVNYKNGNIEKVLDISSQNKPTYYNIYEDKKCVRFASFTDEGYLRWCD